jgi:hypothetical protein
MFYQHRAIVKTLKPVLGALLGPLMRARLILRPSILAALTTVLLFCTTLPLHAANLSSRVDRQEVSSGETLTLTISLDEQVLFGEPDFDSLEKDFEILSRNRQSRFSNNNGKRESYTQWLLTLSPKKTGLLIIPSFSFKGEVSDALEIKVLKPSASSQSNSEIFTEVKLEKSSVYVQEQALLTLRLLTAVPLSNFEMTPLNIPDAQVIKISDKQYQKQVNGKDYIVVESEYAIFPENSGELSIPALRYSGIARLNYERKRIALTTKEQILSVKPRPAEALNTSWLPASAVSLSDNWGNDKPTMTVGEPVTRNITLSAQGLTAAQLPPLLIEQNEDLKIYRDQAQLEDNTNAQGVTGHRIESMAIVPNKSGPLTFPEIRVQWWDTVNEHMATALLPSETFQVLPGAATSPPPAEVTAIPPPNNDALAPSTIAPTENGLMLKALIASNILLALLGITFGIMWWRGRNSQHADASINETTPATSNATLKSVHLAAADHNYPALREAIIHWARKHWQQTSIHTLDQVASKAEDTELKLLFEELDMRLYDKHPLTVKTGVNNDLNNDANTQESSDEKAFDTKALVKHLEAIHQIPTGSKKTKLTELRPLYPE